MTTTKGFDEERTYGVEIEFKGANRTAVKREMEARGLDVEITCYHGNAPDGYWKLETDASCGFEAISPILSGEEGLNEIKRATEALQEVDAKVDKNCGLHIHHDGRDFDTKQFTLLGQLYIKYEEQIDKLVPNSRRKNNNSYCRSLHGRDKRQTFEDMKKCNSISSIVNLLGGSRYRKLNFKAYRQHGTLEFRQHSGTTDYAKIRNWILLTQAIIQRVKRDGTFIQYREDHTMLNIKEIRNIDGGKTRNFYQKRQEYLEVPYRDRTEELNEEYSEVA